MAESLTPSVTAASSLLKATNVTAAVCLGIYGRMRTTTLDLLQHQPSPTLRLGFETTPHIVWLIYHIHIVLS